MLNEEMKGQGSPEQENPEDLDLEESEGLGDSETSPQDEAASGAPADTAAEGEKGEPSGKTEGPEDELSQIQAQLRQLIAEKEKQERHAARKITEQSQEIRSRDLEIERLRREIEELKRQQARASSEFSLFGEEEETAEGLPSQVTERLALYEQALLELNARLEELMNQQSRSSQLRQIQQELGLPEQYARAYLDAVQEGDTVRAAKIVKLAEREQVIKQRRELAQRRQRASRSQVGASGSSPPKTTSAESIRDKLRGMSEWERVQYISQHPELLDELQTLFGT